jgi:AcrR family transcriptional regulator
MPRSKEKVRQRLQEAALDLYRRHGFEQTTTAEIAAKAGVTERTFFRHFPDKREVLFQGETLLKSALVGAVAAAPNRLGPWETLFWAFRSVEPLFVENRPYSEPRQRVIESSPALQERELAKIGSLTAALAAALRERGVADRVATLAAQVGMATLSHALTSWLYDGSGDLHDYLVQAFHELRALSASSSKLVR